MHASKLRTTFSRKGWLGPPHGESNCADAKNTAACFLQLSFGFARIQFGFGMRIFWVGLCACFGYGWFGGVGLAVLILIVFRVSAHGA